MISPSTFPFCKRLHGVVDREVLISWNELLSEDQDFPTLVHATQTLSTLLAILNAMKNKKIIALIDPTTPSHLENSFRLKLDRFLEINPNEGFGIVLQTSGTSGTPKMLLLREKALYYSALGANEFFNINTSSHLALSLPLYHVSGLGLFFRALLADATLHLLQGNLLSSIHQIEEKITHLSLVRTQCSRLIEQKVFERCCSLQHVLLGGSSFPVDHLEKLKSYPFASYLSYGMSETASVVWANSLKNNLSKVLPYRKLASLQDRILMSGKTLFAGYIEDDGSISNPLVNGYFETSDRGSFHQETEMLTLFGRSDDVFLFGGENISKNELEEALGQIQDVRLAMVISLPSSKYGHVPIAILATDLEISFSEWKKKFTTVLSKVKMPKGVITFNHFLDDAPDAKQKLSKLKQQVIEKLAMFEDLPEEGMVQKWTL